MGRIETDSDARRYLNRGIVENRKGGINSFLNILGHVEVFASRMFASKENQKLIFFHPGDLRAFRKQRNNPLGDFFQDFLALLLAESIDDIGKFV